MINNSESHHFLLPEKESSIVFDHALLAHAYWECWWGSPDAN